MAGWVLEVFKMSLYVSFPVALFHYFNSPGNIEEDLAKTQQEYINKYIGQFEHERRREEILARKAKALEQKMQGN